MDTFVNVAVQLNERTVNMRTKLLLMFLLVLGESLYAAQFREEKIDIGKGVVLEIVNLKHEFWVGKYEVTQGEWLAVMGHPAPASPLACHIHDKRQRGDRRPMSFLGLPLAEAFCKAASEKTGRKIRLPTELEWEFYANGTELKDAVCSIGLNPALLAPADVGSKGPNRFGLYDVLGNVMEICSGDWNDYKNPKTGKVWKGTPVAMSGGRPWTCIRGGAYWFNGPAMMKIGFRDFSINQGVKWYAGVGFRVVIDGDGK